MAVQQKTIKNKKLNLKEFKKYFLHTKKITIKDITIFYLQFEDHIKRATLDWRIHYLVQSGILQRIGRGIFTLGEERMYRPPLSRDLKILYNKIHHQFPFANICIWTTKWINEFMVHQPGSFCQIIEVEKDSAESVFYFIREHRNYVFLHPSTDIINKYITGKKHSIIITYLVSEAPIQQIENIRTITLEKMLVDIFCDNVLFAAQQGSELETIYKAAFDKYTINKSKLLRYASRRRRRKVIDNFIAKI